MLSRFRRLIGPTAVALAVVVLAAAPVAAKHAIASLGPGGFEADVSGAQVAKDGTITLKVKYACAPYDAPYDGSDIVIASITSSTGGYDAFAAVTCDGADQQIMLTVNAFNGGGEGDANLQFAHQGISPDGSTGTASVFVNLPIKVVMAGNNK